MMEMCVCACVGVGVGGGGEIGGDVRTFRREVRWGDRDSNQDFIVQLAKISRPVEEEDEWEREEGRGKREGCKGERE